MVFPYGEAHPQGPPGFQKVHSQVKVAEGSTLELFWRNLAGVSWFSWDPKPLGCAGRHLAGVSCLPWDVVLVESFWQVCPASPGILKPWDPKALGSQILGCGSGGRGEGMCVH